MDGSDPRATEGPADAPLAWRLFSRPPLRAPSAGERRAIESAETFRLDYTGPRMDAGGRRLAAYAWGEGPTVYLAHGWGGRGAQLGAFVEPLVERGFRVLAVDAPAHGDSDGRHTNILEFVATAVTVASVEGPLHGVVGHSLGAASAAMAAARGYGPRRLALVSAMGSLEDEVRKFLSRDDLADEARRGLREHIEARFSPRIWEETSLEALALRAGTPALLVHDEHDPEVPWEDVARAAARWRGGTLHGTRGLGHNATLRSSEVAERVAEWIATGA